MLRFYQRMINWMHTKSKEFGDTDCSCFKIEWDCLCEGGGNPSCLGVCGRVCLFGFWFTVDRHGLGALAMTTHSLSLRGGSKSERRGNPWCLRGHGRGCLFAYWITVDRHGLSRRDDKVEVRTPSRSQHTLVIARRTTVRRGNSSGLEGHGQECGLLNDSQWIATG